MCHACSPFFYSILLTSKGGGLEPANATLTQLPDTARFFVTDRNAHLAHAISKAFADVGKVLPKVKTQLYVMTTEQSQPQVKARIKSTVTSAMLKMLNVIVMLGTFRLRPYPLRFQVCD